MWLWVWLWLLSVSDAAPDVDVEVGLSCAARSRGPDFFGRISRVSDVIPGWARAFAGALPDRAPGDGCRALARFWATASRFCSLISHSRSRITTATPSSMPAREYPKPLSMGTCNDKGARPKRAIAVGLWPADAAPGLALRRTRVRATLSVRRARGSPTHPLFPGARIGRSGVNWRFWSDLGSDFGEDGFWLFDVNCARLFLGLASHIRRPLFLSSEPEHRSGVGAAVEL